MSNQPVSLHTPYGYLSATDTGLGTSTLKNRNETFTLEPVGSFGGKYNLCSGWGEGGRWGGRWERKKGIGEGTLKRGRGEERRTKLHKSVLCGFPPLVPLFSMRFAYSHTSPSSLLLLFSSCRYGGRSWNAHGRSHMRDFPLLAPLLSLSSPLTIPPRSSLSPPPLSLFLHLFFLQIWWEELACSREESWVVWWEECKEACKVLDSCHNQTQLQGICLVQWDKVLVEWDLGWWVGCPLDLVCV